MEFFNNINTLLVNSMGPLGPLIALGGLGVLLILAALPTMLKKKIDPFAKVKAQRAPPAMAKKPGDALRKGDKNDKSDKVAKDTKKLNTYETSQELFDNQDWKKAILSYQKYVDENSKGKNTPDAKYKIGVCFQELGMKEEAMAFYEEVIANYGKAESGKKAKIRLSKLKK